MVHPQRMARCASGTYHYCQLTAMEELRHGEERQREEGIAQREEEGLRREEKRHQEEGARRQREEHPPILPGSPC